MDITTLVDEFIEENYGEVSNDDLAYHFYQLGLKDAKEQMMKDAIDAEVGQAKYLIIPTLSYTLDNMGLSSGDKVKLIIVKEEQQ